MEGRRTVEEPKLLWMGGVVERLRKWGNQKRQGQTVAEEGSKGKPGLFVGYSAPDDDD